MNLDHINGLQCTVRKTFDEEVDNPRHFEKVLKGSLNIGTGRAHMVGGLQEACPRHASASSSLREKVARLCWAASC